jgi:hypothetical protein
MMIKIMATSDATAGQDVEDQDHGDDAGTVGCRENNRKRSGYDDDLLRLMLDAWSSPVRQH